MTNKSPCSCGDIDNCRACADACMEELAEDNEKLVHRLDAYVTRDTEHILPLFRALLTRIKHPESDEAEDDAAIFERIKLTKRYTKESIMNKLEREVEPVPPVEACPICRVPGQHKLSCPNRIQFSKVKPEFVDPATGQDCDHGVSFDEVAAKALYNAAGEPSNALEFILGNRASAEIRKRWPRLFGKCPKGCGYEGIAYASTAHYSYGDW